MWNQRVKPTCEKSAYSLHFKSVEKTKIGRLIIFLSKRGKRASLFFPIYYATANKAESRNHLIELTI